jgi:putative FmdB family regulatory protein
MPTYEYLCSNCGNQWEEMQKISAPAQEVCPKCSQHTAKRQISGGNFILKGGGWYADLYSSSKPSKKDGGEKGEGSSSSGSTDKADKSDKGESKSESKSEAPAAKKETPSAAPAASSGGGSTSKE